MVMGKVANILEVDEIFWAMCEKTVLASSDEDGVVATKKATL